MINRFFALVLAGACFASAAIADVQVSGLNLVAQEEEVVCAEGEVADEEGNCVAEEAAE